MGQTATVPQLDPSQVEFEEPQKPPVQAAATSVPSLDPSQVELEGDTSAPPVPYAKPGPYKTSLPPDQEQGFQSWVKQNKVPWQDTPNADYDMRGYYKAMQSGDPTAQQKQSQFDGKMHFPDTFKTPYHKTFSNESMYATPDAPHWEGDKLVDKNGRVIADETPQQMPPAIASQVATARQNIAQYPENQQPPDPDYVQRKNAFEAVQGEPGAPQDFQYDPEQERRIAAQQKVDSQHSLVPQAAMPGMDAFQRHVNEPLEKGSAAGAQYLGHVAERSTADILHPGETWGGTNPAKEEQDIQRLRKEHPALAGVSRSVGGTVGGIAADPRMWPFFFAGPETAPVLNQAMGTTFSVQMAKGAYDQAGELGSILDNPDVPQDAKWEAASNVVLSTLMAGHAEGSKLAKEFSALPPADQEAIRQRIRQKAPDVAAEVEQAAKTPNAEGMNIGQRPDRFKPIVLDPKQVEIEGQKPAGGNVKPGRAAAMKLQEGQKYNGKLYKTAQLDNGDTYVYNPKKTNEQEIRDAAANGTLWKLVGEKAPPEAVAQVQQDLKGEPEEQKKPHDFASTQVNVNPESDLGQRHAQAVASMPDEHIGPNGKEETPHITVRYGLKNDSPEAIEKIKAAAAKIPPFEATVGKTGSFPATKEGDRPIIAHVEKSPELNALRSAVEGAGDFKPDDHGEYKPHVTLGYVKPEHVDKYEGGSHLEGGKVPVDHVVVSKKDRTQEVIKLGGQKQEVPQQLTHEQVEHDRRSAENADLRQRFEKMSPEDRTDALMEYHQRERTSKKTGLPNLLSFEEDGKTMDQSHPHVGYADLDDFKKYNTLFGHKGVDEAVLPHVGQVFARAVAKEPAGTIKAYHISGDEFNFRATTPEAIKRVTDRVNQELAETTFKYQKKDGTIVEKKGIGLSHGIGADHESAEQASHADKAARKAAGLRSGERDEVPAVDTSGRTGEQAPVSQGPERPGVSGKEPDLAAAATQAHNSGDKEAAKQAMRELVRQRLGKKEEANAIRESRPGTLGAHAGGNEGAGRSEQGEGVGRGHEGEGAAAEGRGPEAGSQRTAETYQPKIGDTVEYRGKKWDVGFAQGSRVRLQDPETHERMPGWALNGEIKPLGEKSSYGSKNTVFTADKKDAALKRLRSKMGRLHSGIDPEAVNDLIDIGGYHFEAGLREFRKWSRQMVKDVGDWAIPYLKTIHEEITQVLGKSEGIGDKWLKDQGKTLDRDWYESQVRHVMQPTYDRYGKEHGGHIPSFDELKQGYADYLNKENHEPMTIQDFGDNIAANTGLDSGMWHNRRTIEAEATNDETAKGAEEPAAESEAQGTEGKQRKGAASLVQAVYEKLKRGESLGNVTEFNKLAEEHFGSSRISGEWTPKDAFDAMEAGVNKYLLYHGKKLMGEDAIEGLRQIRGLMERLPSQGVRTEEQIKNQQFSTPPTEAYLVAKVAGIKPSDVVLEPSAGNGGLALWAKAMGAETHVNEIAERRQEMLKEVGFNKPTAHDGELINALLNKNVKPTVVVMNPPFSASTMKSNEARNNNQYGFNHLDQALQRLEPNGRLVAILGGGRADDTNGGATLLGGPSGKWFDRIADRYNVRANIRVNGKEWQKYGTSFATRIIVIDKDGPTPSRAGGVKTWDGVKQANVNTLEEAYRELRDVAESRPEPARTAGAAGAGEREPRAGVGADKNPGGERDREPRGGKPEGSAAERPSHRSDRPGGEPRGNQPSEGNQPVSLREPEVQPAADHEAEAAGRAEGGAENGNAERPVSGLDLESQEERHAEREDTSAYVAYQPSIKGPEHPGSIVETKTMSTVPLPKITYKPALPDSVISEGKLSAVQLEAVSIAGQQNDIVLPSGHRAMALIGDGTGVGKGREGAAIMLDHWNKGRRRIAFVSEKWDLMDAASRDLKAIGAHDLEKKMIPFGKIKAATPIDHEGIIYTTYALVRSEDKKGNTRLSQLMQWLKGQDDAKGAAIIWDEAHNLKNAVTEKGQEASQIGVAARKLMNELPELRPTSLSATAATDVMNMGYMDRLGLWGPGTAFPNGFMEFANNIARGGMSAMEMIARELKSRGQYLARTLSYKGVTYSELEHKITPAQKELYRTATRAWAKVVERAEDTIKNTTNGGPRAKGRFLSQFYSSQQRFFNVLLTTLKIPTAVEKAQRALADGKSVVISLVNTNEAAQNREKNKYRGEEHDSDEVPDYDFGPSEMLAQLIREHYPVQQYMDDVDAAGNPIKTPVTMKDDDGRELPVLNPEAVAARYQLLKEIKRDLPMPANPLDILIEQLGGRDKVAELTGRKEVYDHDAGRFIPRGGKDVKRDEINLSEMRNFQDGKKRIAVLSSAAGTGISLHSDKSAKNQQQRVHITLQPGWSADKAMQMLGRTHRTDQVHPPEYVLLKSDLGGESRFISTIAKRLGSLEALSKGQSKTNEGTDMMSKVNFETDQGRQATNAFYSKLLGNAPIPGTEGTGTEPLKGMQILEDLRVLKQVPGGMGKTVPEADRTNVTRLLNRLLALDPDKQNAVYNYFYDIFDATVKEAVENGTLDTGVKNLPGDTFNIKEERALASDPDTGAKTFYYPIEAKVRTNRMSVDDMQDTLRRREAMNARVLRNAKDGKLVMAIDANPIVHASGNTEPAVQIVSPENGNWKKVAFHTLNQYEEVSKWAEKQLQALQREVKDATFQRDYAKRDVERNPADYNKERLQRREDQLAQAEQKLDQAMDAMRDPKEWTKQEWQKRYEAAPTHDIQEHHLIGGSVMRYWNPIHEASPVLNIYTTVDSKTGNRVVGIDIPKGKIQGLLARISGGKSTVNAKQMWNDVLRNSTPYELEGGIQVKQGRVAGKRVVQFVPPNESAASNLRKLGVIYEAGMRPIHYLADNGLAENTLSRVLKEYPAKVATGAETAEAAPEADRSGERGSATPAAMPIPALIGMAAKGAKKVGELYHGAVDKLLEATHMGQPRPDIRKYDPDAADLALKMDAGGQYNKARGEMIAKKVTGPLTEEFLKTDTPDERARKNEISRDRMKGFHFMADKQNREWVLENHPDDYHRWNSDPKIQKALQEYAPFENDLRAAVKQLGGKTIDEDYIKRVMDFTTAGVAYEPDTMRSIGIEGPEMIRQGGNKTGGASSKDSTVSPQVDRSKSRKDAGQFYWDHGVFDFGPSFQKRWTEIMSKLDEHRLAVHAMSGGTRIDGKDGMPEKIFYNGQEFYRPDIAKEIREINKHGVSSDSKALADQLGVSELPVPKDVRQYGVYEPMKGARFENAARNLASDVLAAAKAGWRGEDNPLTAKAANVNRMAKLRYAIPKEIADALHDAGREKEVGAMAKRIHDLLGPVIQAIRQQVVGLAYGVPHMANVLRKVMQATKGSHLNPQAWANAWKVAFSKELKERGIKGVEDPTYDKLLRYGAISEGAIPEYKHYIEGNLNPANWSEFKETVGNAFRQGGKAEAPVTVKSALAGVPRLLFEPLNRFSEKGHDNLFKAGGIDQRARIWLADYAKAKYPKMSDARIAHEVNSTLGRYNRASWTDVQRAVAPLMFFPGWDYSSITYAMKHPFKTAVAPAVIMAMANAVISGLGSNHKKDEHDLGAAHVGDYSIRTNLVNDNMGSHLWGWALRGGQSMLDRRGTKETTNRMIKGVPGDLAGVSTGTLNPLLGGVVSAADNKLRPGGGGDIVPQGDYKKRGIIPGTSKATTDWAKFAGSKFFPLIDQATNSGGRPSLESAARLAGVNVYKNKKKK